MNVPKEGTPEWRLWIAAIEVATAPPVKQNETAFAAKVPWTRIDKLRRALEDADIDWRRAKNEGQRGAR